MTRRILRLLPVCILLSGCAHQRTSENTVSENSRYLIIAGEPYRKIGSTSTDMLRVGLKRDRVFEPKFLPQLRRDIPAKLVTEAYVSESSLRDLGGGVKAKVGVAKADVGLSQRQTAETSGNYKVFTVLDIDDLIDELNAPDNQRRMERLQMYDRASIVTGVAVAFDREAERELQRSGKVNITLLQGTPLDPEIGIKGEQVSSSTVKLSDGTVFAYKLSRLCWRQSGDRIVVGAIETDIPGKDDGSCPPSTFQSVSALRAAQNASTAAKP